MTPAAVVLPDAAVRMPRAVAGRRALQVVLLLAGLLALGFLCGESAQAADGVPASGRVESARSAEATRPAEPARERVAEPARESAESARETVREAGRDGREAVRDTAVEPVADAAQPVAEAAEPVVRTARGAVRPVVDGVTGVLEGTPQRVLPQAPDLPGAPDAPGMPELPHPGPGSGPGAGEGTGDGSSADVGADPRSPHAGQGETASRKHEARGESSYGTGAGAGAGAGALTGIGTTYPAGQQASGDAVSDDANRTGHEPFPSVPGDPARTLGGQSAGDGSSTRHGDPGAASADSRAAVRLLPGVEAAQASAPVRERHRDIPEFPG